MMSSSLDDKEMTGAVAIDDENAAVAVRDFLVQSEGSVLRAWLRHFDTNHEQRITLEKFVRGMRKLAFMADSIRIFQVLDSDQSGELSLADLDMAEALLWQRFRAWSTKRFENVQDMFSFLGGGIPCVASDAASRFAAGLIRAGWDQGHEQQLFVALESDDNQGISPSRLKWLKEEKRRWLKKEQAKHRAAKDCKSRANNRRNEAAVLEEFKQFLKKKYGNYIRAWRNMSPDGAMSLQKGDLFRAVTAICWTGDVRVLYKAFDRNNSGSITFEELDVKSAELLAQFRTFIGRAFGNASLAFGAWDKMRAKKLRQEDFMDALKAHGFHRSLRTIFHGLDVGGNKIIVQEDLLFLDRWKPPAFLLAPPNCEAAEEVKAHLLKRFQNFLTAWRQLLDPDANNHCDYKEFEEMCSKISYAADIPGAWRALDLAAAGYISLYEIDAESSETLRTFRRWCDEEFGGVKSALGVFDPIGHGEVTFKDFRRACFFYGYEGNLKEIFHALDVDHSGKVSVDEMRFLDDWNFHEQDIEDGSQSLTMPGVTSASLGSDTFEYDTIGPGPAHYTVPSTVGAGPSVPMVKFSGAYSFRKRLSSRPSLTKAHLGAVEFPSPATYDYQAGISATRSTKPSWGFGSARRMVSEPKVAVSKTPGPGEYSPSRLRSASIQGMAFTPRRTLRIHPLQTHGMRNLQHDFVQQRKH